MQSQTAKGWEGEGGSEVEQTERKDGWGGGAVELVFES